MTNTRLIVLDTLIQYEKEGTMLRPLLNAVLDKYGFLDPRDRAFIKMLTEGTVERLITLDHIIDKVSKVSTVKMKPAIRMIVRMGAYQLCFMDHIPDNAAVNEAVKLTHAKHIDGLKGFVNGVLRGVIRYRDKGIEYPDLKTEYSCPDWIYERFVKDHGREKAEMMLKASVGDMPMYLRVNSRYHTEDQVIDALEKEGIKAEGAEILRVTEGSLVPGLSEAFNKGMYSIQDMSSQMAMEALWGQVKDYINQEKIVNINVIDVCASPGGKTCFMAEHLKENGKIKAFDISEYKLDAIRQNIERTRLDNVTVSIGDALSYNEELAQTADVVIADLPCSGLGVLGRKVDIKYRVNPQDIDELCKQQRTILKNAIRYLKNGGFLLFSVCTVTKEETFDQSSFISGIGGEGAEGTQAEADSVFAVLQKTDERMFLQGCDPCDGFYYAIFKKVSENKS
ncbi:MAG: 16S rRNA (cytosine(967)-C(5))-methyltransferase RsmB [Lachnospiraceae bacterium]|nr:16S rRNA (cytosine(967)-C(5))-methyltransferase RsmB [Lachnospiraceae bacterium]